MTMTTIRCDIVSAEEEIFHGDVTMVVATGEMGELGIAPRHAPLITRLKPGKLVLTLADGEKVDIVELKVKAAKDEAERVLANRGEAMEVAEAQAKLAEAMAQLQALERLRKNLKH
jgi:F-type H+-transporting ATPase subunit epsilon